MLKRRTAAQLFLLAVGIAMIGFGLWRGDPPVYGVCWNWIRKKFPF